MAINVNVSGNPISIRRGKMVFSDLENSKRVDREHRKRLRLEQVKEQSKAIARNILEKARRISKEELDRLDRNGNTQMHRAYDRKLMECVRRYQDIENIGYAQENAANQPDVESLKQAEEEKSQALARARGAEAAQRLQELNDIANPKSRRYDRINKVRQLEDERAHMVAQLPRRSRAVSADLSDNENVEVNSSKRKFKRVVSKKTPIKKVPKVQSKSTVHKQKTPSKISVTINGEDISGSSKKATSENKSKKINPSKISNVPKKVSDITEEGNFDESDDNEPRRSLPVTSKPSKFSCLGNYEIHSDLSSNSSTSSRSSNDSSYYSDNISKNTVIRVTPKHHPSPVASKVSVYDHNTRQRNTYDMPPSLVERVNVQDELNAEEMARKYRELKKRESAALAAQVEREKQRCQDAIRREKVRRDYQELMKRLEELCNEDMKLRAKKISYDMDQQVLAPSKKCQDKIKRQKKMDRALEAILRSSHELGVCDRPIERPVTITPRDQRIQSQATPITGWKDPPYLDARESNSSSEDDEEYDRKKKILELLTKVEKSKRKLLHEYGDNLPDNVFNAVMNSINQLTTDPPRQERTECHGRARSKTPEIQVVNMSGGDDNKSSQKYVCKPKRPYSNKPATRTFVRSCSKNTPSTCDQEVQVELQDEKTKEKETTEKYPIDPVVKIITPENVESSTSLSSNSSTGTDVVIDADRQGVTVDRKKRDSNVRIGKKSSVTSVRTGNCNTPVKINFEDKNGGQSLTVTGVVIDRREIQLLTQLARKSPEFEERSSPIVSGAGHSLRDGRKSSPAKKLSRSAPPTGHSSPKKSPSRSRASANYMERRYKTQYTQVSIDSSTESSTQFNSTSDTGNGSKLFHTRFQAMAAKRVVTTTTNGHSGNSDSIYNNNHRHLQETSDASTTYASPPAATACAMLNAMNSSTPILELLDSSSANETLRRKARQVSPVSSPETPSPRTIKLPSNIPRPDNRAGRNLKLLLEAAQTRPTSSKTTSKSTRTSSFTPSTNKSSSAKTQTTTPRTSHQPCTCKNPACKLFHNRAEEELQRHRTYSLGYCPEVLKAFEDLQNVHSERIASLTDLIELLRNEEMGLELSAITSDNSKLTGRSDATSQPSTSTNLTKNIEAIHAQLKKTLEDSEKIISSKGIKLPPKLAIKHGKASEKSLSTSTIDLSKETVASESLDDEASEEPSQHATPTGPTKLRIVNEQCVNIPLERFQHYPKPTANSTEVGDKKKSTATATESATADKAEAAANALNRSEQMVEMLSKEILEQSKSINKSPPVDNLKDSDDSLLKTSQAALKDSGNSSKHAVSTDEQNQSGNLDTSNSDYVPLLAGIPKIARTKNSSNGRTRPPVTLISGPYRPEIVSVSPAHELSTIVEFDTPDTANKSQVSTRSPSNKARKKLVPTGEAVPLTPSSSSKTMDTNVTKNKPSLQVAPFPMHQSLNISKSSDKQTSKKSLEKSPRRSVEQSPKRSSDKLSKKSVGKSLESLEESKRAAKNEADKNLSSESMHTLPELHIEQLQQSQDNADGNYDLRISQISELQSLPDETIDQMLISELCEESKSKSVTPEQQKIHQRHDRESTREPEQDKGQLTLTSTASLSGISGVSEISTTPSSDVQPFKCPSSSDEMELALKKWGLGSWVPTLKKNREASALGSSSSSDVTPVNTGARLVNSVKKDSTPHELLLAEISDVSSISVKFENKSTERSVLGRAGRTSTPNRHLLRSFSNHSDNSNGSATHRNATPKNSNESNHSNRTNNSHHSNRTNHSNHSVNSNHSNNSNSDGTVSLSSFSSDINIVVQNQSADMSVPNISFSNNNLG